MTTVVNSALRAMHLKEAEQEKSSSYYTGRLWAHYKKTAGMSPTSSPVFNKICGLIFAITALAPYLILTVGAIQLDILAMTGRALAYVYNSLRGKVEEKNNSEKVLDFIEENQTEIIAAVALLAVGTVSFIYRAEIGSAASSAYNTTKDAVYNGYTKVKEGAQNLIDMIKGKKPEPEPKPQASGWSFWS